MKISGDYHVIVYRLASIRKRSRKEIRKQVDALLEPGVIKESQATEWSQVHHRFHHRVSSNTSAFITQYGLFEWNRVAMGLKGLGPFFQRSTANKVLVGYVTRICEICIDDVLLFGATDNEYLGNKRKVLVRLRDKKVTANPAKTRLGHLISSKDISFTVEKRLQVLCGVTTSEATGDGSYS